jgi:tRNA pseudouridine38-40 synthase
MAFFKLTLAYDGADFSGWQAQPERRTVQGELERAWREITGDTVRVSVAGRTDAGVHAIGQVASVESATNIPPEALVLALNAKLSEDVAVQAVESAPDGFHATRDAKCKRYRYSIYNDRRRPVFWRRYAWHVPTPLDVDAMHRAGQALVGPHDFVSFQSTGSERESTVRTIFAVEVTRAAAPGSAPASESFREKASPQLTQRDPGAEPGAERESDALVTIDVEGDGFLYNMVRAIAGTLVEVGRGKRDVAWVAQALAARDRSAAGRTAPAHGLMLLRVDY